MRYIKIFTALAICLLLIPVLAQQLPNGIPAIEQAIDENKIDRAKKMFQEDVQRWLSKGNIDTLIGYIPLKAALAEKTAGPKAAIKETYQFIALLSNRKMTATQSVIAYHSLAMYCETAYELQEAYNAMLKALSFADNAEKQQKYNAALCEYNLAVFAYKLGNIALSEEHHRRALALRLSNPATPQEDLYFSYNGIGTILWHSSLYDSAQKYFTKALETVKKMPQENVNMHLRPALIKNNLAAIYREKGNISLALKTTEEIISDYQQFLKNKGGEEKKRYATESLFAAIDNLGGIYQDIGDYKKAENLLLYSYQQKLEKMKGSQEIAVSEVLLGQHYNRIRDFKKSKEYLDNGLKHLKEDNGNYTFWQADAQYALALVYENTNQPDEAAKAYEESEQLYEQAYGGSYDNTYMEFLNNKALFFASLDRYREAISTADKTGNYLASIGQEKSTQGFLHLLNLAEINYRSKHYSEAIQYSNRALSHLQSQFQSGNSLLDSIRSEVHKPKTILIKTQSAYALQPKKDSLFLSGLYNQLDTAVQILERRKVFIDDAESVNLLMAEYQQLINFFTQVSFELYNQTSATHFLEKFINMREAALYSRIRSRLNKEKAIRFSNIPEDMIEKENKLKDEIQSALNNTGKDSGQLDHYLAAIKKWEQHLDEQKKQYPQYYRLRYATLFYKLPELQQLIPENTTLVRYYMMDSSLVALVADRNTQKIIPLDASGLTETMNTVLQNNGSEQEQLALLYHLYQQIWAPVGNTVKTKKVMVIPDGSLYNVSIDMLPYEPVKHFSELAEKSLLSRFTFSYHYSPFMLEETGKDEKAFKNYIAFAPGFSDNLKNDYLHSIKDSLQLDRKYLTLLPQPASNQLAQKLNDQIGGQVFLDGSSTASAFRDHADRHKIIHIATHAEYNNAIPEQSGLFFAKAKEDNGTNDNFLTLSEIYRCSMNADLMILTACESGKPGYQDGEGLVSLAHAFNYAGSRNILTALWKIDERSSAAIAEQFIYFLEQGMPTDEALRQAKLDYLQKNEGRVLAPAYWSGLVLMGKPLTLELDKPRSYLPWVIGGVGLIIVLAGLFVMKQKRKKL